MELFDFAPKKVRQKVNFILRQPLNRITGRPWPAIHFSAAGRTRFDPAEGKGTLYLGEKLEGILLEIFNDSWGAVGSGTRYLRRRQLETWRVSEVYVPPSICFDARSGNLSKIGTDFQLLTGEHTTSQKWALRMMNHPARIGGIIYSSRHNPAQCNLALFKENGLLPAVRSKQLHLFTSGKSIGSGKLKYSNPRKLAEHPGLYAALANLEVAILPG